MEFLQPVAGWLALTLIPVVLLYLLKIQPKFAPVATFLFWQEAGAHHASRSLWQRFRRSISLLVSLLFVLLLVVAAMDPVARRDPSNHVLFVLDNSASMTTTDDSDTTRFSQAKHALLQQVSKLRHGQYGTFVATSGPEIAVAHTRHKGRLKAAIEQTTITATGHNNPDAALALAYALVPKGEQARAVIATDRTRDSVANLATDIETQWLQYGSEAGNVAIIHFSARRVPGDPEMFEGLAELANFSHNSVSLTLTTRLNEVPVDIRKITMTAGEEKTVLLRGRSERGGILTCELNMSESSKDCDAMTVDNKSQLKFNDLTTMKFLQSGRRDYFLEHLLASLPRSQVEVVSSLPQKIPEGEILFATGGVRGTVPQGDVVILSPDTDCNLFNLGEELEFPVVSDMNSESSFLANVTLRNHTLAGARKIEIKDVKDVRVTTLASTAEGDPLLIYFEGAGQRVFVVNANPSQGDFALRTAFPILLDNIIRCFHGDIDFAQGIVATDLPGREESDLRMTDAETVAGRAASKELAHETGNSTFTGNQLWSLLLFAAVALSLIEWHAWHRRLLE
ncbi:MAG: BatA and WFA domain-containing protein [Planctomycetia bacterium]|nr:BatA and WFA domain-containing protein [Planctomycetia bacterium]